MSGIWIPISNFLDELEKLVGDSDKAKSSLMRRLRAGTASARAGMVLGKTDLGLPEMRPGEEVPSSFWMGLPGSPHFWVLPGSDDIELWTRSYIKDVGVSDARMDVTLFDVAIQDEWQSQKFERPFELREPQVQETQPSRSGRKLSDAWPEFVAELAIQAADGRIFNPMSAAALYKLVADALAESGKEAPPLNTVRPTLSAILKRFGDEGI